MAKFCDRLAGFGPLVVAASFLLVAGWLAPRTSVVGLLAAPSASPPAPPPPPSPGSTNENAPVMVEDGQDNFLILNEDEVKANSKLLSFLATASKEDVEEIVDNNPHMQEMILGRIKGAVDQRRRDRQAAKGANIEGPTKGGGGGGDGNAEAPTAAKQQMGPLGLPRPNPKYDMKIDDDEEEEDSEQQVDEQQVARWRAQIQRNALKVFKIGRGLRDQIAALTRRRTTNSSSGSNSTQAQQKRKRPARRWPHFHYKISTS